MRSKTSDEKPKFFGRRIGRRVKPSKAALLDEMLPALRVGDGVSPSMFGFDVSGIRLEIGFGDGRHLLGQAKANPGVGFIGAEVFVNGVANLLEAMAEEASLVKNIRIFDDDIRLLFARIPDGFLDVVYLLFPDPWPKKRHAERRFVNRKNLDEISRMLKPGGLLRIATDHPVYKVWTLRKMREREDFSWTARCSDDWRREPADWVRTKYQMKAIAEGRRPVFLDYRKNPCP